MYALEAWEYVQVVWINLEVEGQIGCAKHVEQLWNSLLMAIQACMQMPEAHDGVQECWLVLEAMQMHWVGKDMPGTANNAKMAADIMQIMRTHQKKMNPLDYLLEVEETV